MTFLLGPPLSLWALAALVALPLGLACRGFVRLKARTHSAWMSYL